MPSSLTINVPNSAQRRYSWRPASRPCNHISSPRTRSQRTRTLGVRALREMSNRRTNPPQTLEQILELLVTRHKMAEVAEILLPLLASTGDPADQAGKAFPPTNSLTIQSESEATS